MWQAGGDSAMTVEDPGQRVCHATWGRDIGLVELGRF